MNHYRHRAHTLRLHTYTGQAREGARMHAHKSAEVQPFKVRGPAVVEGVPGITYHRCDDSARRWHRIRVQTNVHYVTPIHKWKIAVLAFPLAGVPPRTPTCTSDPFTPSRDRCKHAPTHGLPLARSRCVGKRQAQNALLTGI